METIREANGSEIVEVFICQKCLDIGRQTLEMRFVQSNNHPEQTLKIE